MSKRDIIIQLHWTGRTKSETIKLLKVAKSTVYHVVKRFKELGRSEDRPRSGRISTARSKLVIKTVRERVWTNPKRSARQMAKNVNVSVTLLKRFIKNDLKILP